MLSAARIGSTVPPVLFDVVVIAANLAIRCGSYFGCVSAIFVRGPCWAVRDLPALVRLRASHAPGVVNIGSFRGQAAFWNIFRSHPSIGQFSWVKMSGPCEGNGSVDRHAALAAG